MSSTDPASTSLQPAEFVRLRGSLDGSRPHEPRPVDGLSVIPEFDGARRNTVRVSKLAFTTALPSLTDEQLCVVDTLLQARSRAAALLAAATSRMRHAALAHDARRFLLARAESAAAARSCDSAGLAVEVAVASFLAINRKRQTTD